MSDQIFNVRFYKREVELPFKSGEEGRPIYEMRDFVRIEIPGRSDLIIDTQANEDHKRRFPVQWADFKNRVNEEGATEFVGTKLADWSILNQAQVRELEHFRFYTVEQVAEASDGQLSSIAMVAGMSPVAFRDKARAYLSNAKDTAVVMQQAEQIAKERAEKDALRQQMAEMARQMEDMRNAIEGRDAKRGPGRPRKEAEAAQ
jgi:hypothetical protein